MTRGTASTLSSRCVATARRSTGSRWSAQNSYQLELEDVNAAIRGERGALLGREDAMAQVRTIEALFRSSAEGRRVSL